MPKTLPTLLVAAAAAALGFAAAAQEPMMQPSPTTPRTTPPSPSGDPPVVPPDQGDTVDGVVRKTPPPVAAPGAPLTPAAPFKTGVEVRDARGMVIGTVSGAGVGADGPTITLIIDGKPYTIAQSLVTRSGDTVVSSKTKAQIIAMNQPET
ncbi:MAG: hypothetical protein GC145_04250 [Caulobacter sp.]|nr:hypothetical protein [Caulobacter sp.]